MSETSSQLTARYDVLQSLRMQTSHFRVALERSVVESAAPVPAEFVQLFADVKVTLRVALERSVVDPLLLYR